MNACTAGATMLQGFPSFARFVGGANCWGNPLDKEGMDENPFPFENPLCVMNLDHAVLPQHVHGTQIFFPRKSLLVGVCPGIAKTHFRNGSVNLLACGMYIFSFLGRGSHSLLLLGFFSSGFLAGVLAGEVPAT